MNAKLAPAGIKLELCTSCGNIADRCCSSCIEGLDRYGNPSSTWYCSEICELGHAQEHIRGCDAANYRKQLYRTGAVLQEMFYSARHCRSWFDKVDRLDRTKDSAGRLQRLHVYLSKASLEDYDAFATIDFETFVEKRAVLVSGAGSHAVRLLKSSFETWLGLKGRYLPPPRFIRCILLSLHG